MNEKNLQQIFANYIDRFEEFNSKDKKQPSEYYKWTMPPKFKDCMGKALIAQSGEEFNCQLREIGKITQDFIDSGKTLPFAGLVKFAGEYGKWETVQKMFQGLYADDNGDLERRQRKIQAFLNQAHQLRETYNLSGLYKSDFRSVTCYLFLYDPDHNYIWVSPKFCVKSRQL